MTDAATCDGVAMRVTSERKETSTGTKVTTTVSADHSLGGGGGGGSGGGNAMSRGPSVRPSRRTAPKPQKQPTDGAHPPGIAELRRLMQC